MYYLEIKLDYLSNSKDKYLKVMLLESILVDLRAWLLEKQSLKKYYFPK